MNTRDIYDLLSSDIWVRQTELVRVLPIDQLPRYINPTKTAAIIVNTDPSYRAGSHWVGLYYNGLGKFTYFDSFGLPPRHREIMDFIERNSTKPYSYNPQIIQDLLSNACGLYAVYFIMIMCRGGSMQTVVRHFKPKQWVNDRVVYSLLRTRLARQLRGRQRYRASRIL